MEDYNLSLTWRRKKSSAVTLEARGRKKASSPIKILLPSKKFENVLNTLKKIASIYGVNILVEDYHFSFMTYLIFAFIALFFSCTFYTLYVGVVINNDWTVCVQVNTCIGTALQGVTKLISGVHNAAKFRDLVGQIERMHVKYERLGKAYESKLWDTYRLLKRIVQCLSLISLFASIGMAVVPIFLSYYMNKRILVMQFLIPGLDIESEFGFLMIMIAQVICIIFGFVGNWASDILFIILIVHIPLMKNILKCKLDDLDKVLQEYPIDSTKTTELLKDMFQWHQQYIAFSGITKDCFFWVIFVQIATATNSIINTILCQFLGIMPTAPIYLVYSFVVLYTFAGVGNLVELSNEDLTASIYDCSWYLLTAREQKMIMLMLRESQQTDGMSIGGISPLSLNSALQITKTIYSVTMMLNQFFNRADEEN